ncbi:hypothetical protein ACFORL_08350 [Legionella dresdenensis]|uniref:Uncharacterized protein n=1 Tax=Legionella dresdenensis TaxID=450200 RepID=A0ABV8CFG3_9GAMM
MTASLQYLFISAWNEKNRKAITNDPKFRVINLDEQDESILAEADHQNVEELHITGNNISATALASISKIKSLKTLSLSSKSTKTFNLKTLGELLDFQQLKELQITFIPVERSFLELLATAVNLKKLRLCNCSLNNQNMFSIARIKHLEELDISLNLNIDINGLLLLKLMPRLKSLDVTHIALKDNAQFLFGTLPLEKLKIDFCGVGDETLAAICRRGSVQHLSAQGNQFTDLGYRAIKTTRALVHFDDSYSEKAISKKLIDNVHNTLKQNRNAVTDLKEVAAVMIAVVLCSGNQQQNANFGRLPFELLFHIFQHAILVDRTKRSDIQIHNMLNLVLSNIKARNEGKKEFWQVRDQSGRQIFKRGPSSHLPLMFKDTVVKRLLEVKPMQVEEEQDKDNTPTQQCSVM